MKRQSSNGFTLMEILVVMAILGIVAAVAVPAYQNYMTRARAVEALEFADAARIPVELSLVSGTAPDKDLLASGGKKVDMMTALTWNPPKPGSNLTGYILAEMELPRFGARKVLVLERGTNGDWHCTSAVGYVGADQALDPGYLPAGCRERTTLAKAGGAGTAPGATTGSAPVTPNCATDQEQITTQDSNGKSHPVCAKRCAAGQKRDPANLAGCIADTAAAAPPVPAAPSQKQPTSQSDCLPHQFFLNGRCLNACATGSYYIPSTKSCDVNPPANTNPPTSGAAAASSPAPAPAQPKGNCTSGEVWDVKAQSCTPTPAGAPDCSGEILFITSKKPECKPICLSFQVRNWNTGNCDPKPVPAQTQKPTAANNPCGPQGVWMPSLPVVTKGGVELMTEPDFSKGAVAGGCVGAANRNADPYADVMCHQCTGPVQICEQIHFPRPCKWPNNLCTNHVTNHLDGTRTVARGCGHNDYAYREWYLGTSDEDKCDALKNNQHVDFQCVFVCTTDNCNVPLRPAEKSLWEPGHQYE